jgi:hypothetical protein
MAGAGSRISWADVRALYDNLNTAQTRFSQRRTAIPDKARQAVGARDVITIKNEIENLRNVSYVGTKATFDTFTAPRVNELTRHTPLSQIRTKLEEVNAVCAYDGSYNGSYRASNNAYDGSYNGTYRASNYGYDSSYDGSYRSSNNAYRASYDGSHRNGYYAYDGTHRGSNNAYNGSNRSSNNAYNSSNYSSNYTYYTSNRGSNNGSHRGNYRACSYRGAYSPNSANRSGAGRSRS